MRIFLILLFLCTNQVNAQPNERFSIAGEDFITFDLCSPFYVKRRQATPRWRIGFVKAVGDHHKIGMAIGYGNENNFIVADKGYTLWEIRPEYYYVINPSKKSLQYFSAELFFLQQKQHFISGRYRPRGGRTLIFDEADYRRNKFGVIPKIGMFIHLSNRLGLDMYTGVGLRLRSNRYLNVMNARQDVFFEEHRPSYFRKEGDKLGAEFSLGLKLFYRININPQLDVN